MFVFVLVFVSPIRRLKKATPWASTNANEAILDDIAADIIVALFSVGPIARLDFIWALVFVSLPILINPVPAAGKTLGIDKCQRNSPG